MPAPEIKFGGFSKLAYELQEDIISYAVRDCIWHKKEPPPEKEHSFHPYISPAKISASNLRRLAFVNKRFRSSSSLKLAIDRTKYWIRATEAESFASLRACIRIGKKKLSADEKMYQEEIYQSAQFRARVLLSGSYSAEYEELSKDILESSVFHGFEVTDDILSSLCCTRVDNQEVIFPPISAAMEYLDTDKCEGSYNALTNVAQLLISLPYEEQKDHWDDLLPKICSYDKQHDSYISFTMMKDIHRVPREERLRRLCTVFDHMFDNESQMPSAWHGNFVSLIKDLHVDDQPEACQKILGITIDQLNSRFFFLFSQVDM